MQYPKEKTTAASVSPSYKVCDYSDTDYSAFWKNSGREYEDTAERIALRRMTKSIHGSCLEIGAGYGRLVNEYAHLCTFVTLADYAENMVNQAKTNVLRFGLENVNCIRANLYDLDKCEMKYNNAICIRVLHHVENVPAFFEQVNKVLKQDGVFIFEYANKKNLAQILRFILRKPNAAPFGYAPSKIGAGVYYNFHPDYIRDTLEQNGFVIEQELAVSIFRNNFVKKLLGHRFLSILEAFLQKPLSHFYPAPSVFVKARKLRSLPLSTEANEP